VGGGGVVVVVVIIALNYCRVSSADPMLSPT
jgi:hypothetical protein